MALPPAIDLIVATLDLNLVRSVRHAMRAADLAAGRGQPVSSLGPAPSSIRPRPVHEPTPRFEPRPVHEPTPRFDPRPVHHPEPAVRPDVPAPVPAVAEPEQSRIADSPIQPPWKTLPWDAPPTVACPAKAAQVAPRLKLVSGRPDVALRGTILDLFV